MVSFSQEKGKYKVFPTDDKIIFDICFFDHGEKLAVADNTAIKIFSTKTNQLLDKLKYGHSKRILTIDVSSDNTLLASGGRDSTVVIWDLNEKSTVKNYSLKDGIVTALSISTNNKSLAVGSSSGTVLIYDLENNKQKHELNDHKKDITCVKFSPDENLLAMASGDKTINLYSTETWKLITSLKGHKNWVREVTFDEDSKKLISCGDDSKVIFWNLSDLQNISSKKKTFWGYNWITGIDLNTKNDSYVIANITGNIEIITPLSRYKINVQKPVSKVLFIPNEDSFLKVVAATQGSGVISIEAENMKFLK